MHSACCLHRSGVRPPDPKSGVGGARKGHHLLLPGPPLIPYELFVEVEGPRFRPRDLGFEHWREAYPRPSHTQIPTRPKPSQREGVREVFPVVCFVPFYHPTECEPRRHSLE